MPIDEEIRLAKYLVNQDYSSVNAQFKGVTPVYPFNTEDSANIFLNYRDYIKNHKVLTVTGSGDALLDLIVNGAKSITCFDTNCLSKYIASLKLAFAKAQIDDNLFLRFFSGTDFEDEIFEYEIYKLAAPYLDPRSRYFFESLYAYMREKNIKIRNNSSTIVYSKYASFIPFLNVNETIGNANAYLSKYNYQKLLNRLVDSEEIKVYFVDSELFNLKNILNDEFFFIYLSNIIDFTSEFIDKETLEERLQVFKDYINEELYPYLSNNGLCVAGFIGTQVSCSDDIYHNSQKYENIFDENSGFLIDDVYGVKGSTIVRANPKVIKKIKSEMYDFF